MSRKSGYRFSEMDLRQRKMRTSRKKPAPGLIGGGYRFSKKDVRQHKEGGPYYPFDRDTV